MEVTAIRDGKYFNFFLFFVPEKVDLGRRPIKILKVYTLYTYNDYNKTIYTIYITILF